jgi:ATP-dependent protease ClpP protease subunit
MNGNQAGAARSWYRFAAAARADERDLLIYDEIGVSYDNDQAVTAKQFIEDLAALPSTVRTLRVRVNSPGGNPFDAVAIANALRDQRVRHSRIVEMHIDGLAASAATVITCAGAPIRMVENALLMVHDPYSVALGTADDFRALASALDQVKDTIITTYRWVSSKTVQQLADMMKATTWMDAKTAKANGFVTEIVAASWTSARASIRPEVLAKFGKPPRQLHQVATVAPSTRRVDTRSVYRERAESAEKHASAPVRPRTMRDLAGSYYGPQGSDAEGLISTSERAGR